MKAADYTAVYTETIIRNGDNKIICDIRARILTVRYFLSAVYTETIIRNGDNKIICDIRARILTV